MGVVHNRSGGRRGFTLVELLVVIAIIGVLVALLLPAVQAAREAARRMSCSNNAKQIALALHNYHDTHKTMPLETYWAYGTPNAWLPRNYSWLAMTLPFLEQGTISDQINFRLPLWDQFASDGRRVVGVQVPVFRCPSDPGLGPVEMSHEMSVTNYVGAEGYDWWNRRSDPLGGVFTFQTATKFADIADGTSNTIAFGEATSFGYKNGGHLRCGTGVPRTSAGEAVFHPALVSPPFSDSQGSANTTTGGYPSPDGVNNPQQSWVWWRAGPHAYKPTYLHCFGINADWPGVSSAHPAGAMFGFCDGSVQFLADTIDYPGENHPTVNWSRGAGVWGALNTKRGAEPVAVP
ncbi:MAG: DUF1559 family PulG-like putative transporter [Pirellulaceae bacterium]